MPERPPFRALRASYVVLAGVDIDTDQIIPARFLKITDKSDLARACFADWRWDEHGAPRPEFPLNRPDASGAAVLVAGHNFGCGSSREHASWALLAAGIRAVVSTRFADIFQANALKNGLLPVTVTPDVHERLVRLAAPGTAPVLEIDVAAQRLALPDGTLAEFPLDPFAKHCLLAGVDELGYLLALDHEIAAWEHTHPPRITVEAS